MIEDKGFCKGLLQPQKASLTLRVKKLVLSVTSGGVPSVVFTIEVSGVAILLNS